MNLNEMLNKILENKKDRADLVRMLRNEVSYRVFFEIVETIHQTRAAENRREIVLSQKPRGIFTE